MSTTNYSWTPQHPRVVADLTGDGRADIVGFGADGVWTSLNDGGTGFGTPAFRIVAFEANSGWRPGDHPRFVTDLTGDGHADLLGFGDDGVWVALGNGDGSFAPAQFVLAELGFNKGWSADYPRYLADLTGDGRPDIVGFGMDGVWVALNNGSGGFQPAALVSGDLAYNTGWRVGNHPRFVTDLTGDGHADLLGFGDDGVWVALGNGDGSFAPAQFVLAELGFNKGWSADYPRYLADLTGDGRPDIIGFGMDGVWVALNNGSGGFQPAALVSGDLAYNTGWRVGNHPRFVTDLTGDGHADLLGFGDDGVWVALGNGDGSFAPAQFVLAELGFNKGWRVDEHPRFLADVNGDGRPDIVGFGTDGVWVAISNGAGGFEAAAFVLADFGRGSNRDLVVRREIVRDMRPRERIKHLFVLMLENRSFDHLLGWADIKGTDAATGQPTAADGLKGTEFNTHAGAVYPVTRGAPDVTVAPGHDFTDALEQLGGGEATYPSGGPYPDISNTGFVSNLVGGNRGGPAEVMRCFDPKDVPILTQLATEFAVCDRWFSSLPGPTEPNRYFSHAANSNGFDESPSPWQIANASTNHWGGFDVGQHIFDALDDADVEFGIYAGDWFPVVGELDGVSNTWDVDDWDEFLEDIKDPDFDKSFIHLEPQYFSSIGDTIGADFSGGNSQHPSGGVAAGEKLIKQVYEAIRNSPHWNSSMLIVTYDEHGGFYDHVAPGPAKPAGTRGDSHGFMFDQLGLRVPAVVISPYVAKGVIEHRELEHCSILKTVCDLFDVPHLKQGRDLNTICGVLHLAYLREPRTDTPATLHDVVVSDFVPPEPGWRRGDLSDLSGVVVRRVAEDGHVSETPAAPVPAADEPVWGRQDSFIGTSLRAAAVRYAALEPERKKEILDQAASVQTVGQATTFLNEAQEKVEASRHAPPSTPPATPPGGQLDPSDVGRITRPVIDRRRPGPG